MGNLSSSTINYKAVLEQLVSNNAKLANRNAVLAVTNKQLSGEVKTLCEQANSSRKTGVKAATYDWKSVATVPLTDKRSPRFTTARRVAASAPPTMNPTPALTP